MMKIRLVQINNNDTLIQLHIVSPSIYNDVILSNNSVERILHTLQTSTCSITSYSSCYHLFYFIFFIYFPREISEAENIFKKTFLGINGFHLIFFYLKNVLYIDFYIPSLR